MCLVTVRGLRPRMSATSRLVLPRATQCSTSASRAVSLKAAIISSSTAASLLSLATISHSSSPASALAGPAGATAPGAPGSPAPSPIACSAKVRRRPPRAVTSGSGAAPLLRAAASRRTQSISGTGANGPSAPK